MSARRTLLHSSRRVEPPRFEIRRAPTAQIFENLCIVARIPRAARSADPIFSGSDQAFLFAFFRLTHHFYLDTAHGSVTLRSRNDSRDMPEGLNPSPAFLRIPPCSLVV